MSAKLSRLGVASLLVFAAAACDFEVINPGPTDDRFLDKPEAHQAIANGAALYLFDALNNLSYTTSAVTRELFPAGSTSSFGISNFQQAGRLLYDDEHIYDGPWFPVQRSRYIGESGFARMAATLAEDANKAKYPNGVNGYKPAVEAALYAAYAYRLLGENFCEVAFDGGSIEPRVNAQKRAETWFTKVIDAAGSTASLATQKTAAYAGRAAVRVQLGDWTGALADAAMVPTTFTYYARYEETQQDQYNRTYFAGINQPYRAATVWNTVYEKYYTDTKDPRVPWTDTKLLGDAAVLLVGNIRVPFYRQEKFNARGSDILLSSGREMRLIEAEKMLKDNNITGAMAILNARRAALTPAQPALAPADITEAWTMFKRERGIELWLEGRRLGDLFRWKATNTPGALHELEQAGNPKSFLSAEQTLCYPIARTERQDNPNIPDTP
ncbi:MAG TPA: RagB/SusD family nutrient uptake outer membrane protein [Longimicrobiales bacterium]|nr:RagB/SusD family nutrient uptake outer membrane protein [Longimicrobiales bacterium]